MDPSVVFHTDIKMLVGEINYPCTFVWFANIISILLMVADDPSVARFNNP